MNNRHQTAELHRLLKQGYSAEDLRTNLSASADQVEQAVSLYREEIKQRVRDRALHNQAVYAMRLR